VCILIFWKNRTSTGFENRSFLMSRLRSQFRQSTLELKPDRMGAEFLGRGALLALRAPLQRYERHTARFQSDQVSAELRISL
jgi:hypothetical protein